MTKKKITHGYVVQTFDGPKCVHQEFVAVGTVEYENDFGGICDPIENEIYQPFDMIQPDQDDMVW